MIGYILAVIFGLVWIGIKIYENYKEKRDNNNDTIKAVNADKNSNTGYDDLIL